MSEKKEKVKTVVRGMSLREAAGTIGCSPGFLRAEAERGHLRVTRLGSPSGGKRSGRILVLNEDWEEYLAKGRSA